MSEGAAQIPDQTPPFKAAALAVLRDHADELRSMGVTGIWLFGSVARGDDDEQSDLDIAVSTDADGLDAVVVRGRTREYLEPIMGRAVDVAGHPLRRRLRPFAQSHLVSVL